MTAASNSARTCAKLSGSGVQNSLSSRSDFMAGRLGRRGGECQAMEPSLVNRTRLPRRNGDRCALADRPGQVREPVSWACASGSVSVPLDLLHKIDNSTPELSIANPRERFG